MTGLSLAFAAGDPGGARAILPVARAAAARGITVAAMRHGVLHDEGAEDWVWRDPAVLAQPGFWTRADAPAALIYATSVKDMAAVSTALVVQAVGRPIVHVLDNWSNYAARLSGPGGARCLPDIYAVMDALAAEGARRDGVPAALVRVTGHPGLARLADEAAALPGPAATGPRSLLFVSEPARSDSGGPEAPGWRGYDEDSISALAAAALARPSAAAGAAVLRLRVVPHPRENPAEVARRWRGLGAAHGLDWTLVAPDTVRPALHAADAVLGMSSILLYEGWLLGKPVLSLQPGLRQTDLSALGQRDGLILCTEVAQAGAAVARLIVDLVARAQALPAVALRSDLLARHVGAADRVLDLALAAAQTITRADSIHSWE